MSAVHSAFMEDNSQVDMDEEYLPGVMTAFLAEQYLDGLPEPQHPVDTPLDAFADLEVLESGAESPPSLHHLDNLRLDPLSPSAYFQFNTSVSSYSSETEIPCGSSGEDTLSSPCSNGFSGHVSFVSSSGIEASNELSIGSSGEDTLSSPCSNGFSGHVSFVSSSGIEASNELSIGSSGEDTLSSPCSNGFSGHVSFVSSSCIEASNELSIGSAGEDFTSSYCSGDSPAGSSPHSSDATYTGPRTRSRRAVSRATTGATSGTTPGAGRPRSTGRVSPSGSRAGGRGARRTLDAVIECDLCNKRAKRRYMSRHMRIHCEARYRCTQCPHAERQRQNLTRHMKVTHHIDANGQHVEPYRCDHDDCTFTNYRQDKVREHAKRTHRKTSAMQCPLSWGKKGECKFFCYTQEQMSLHREHHDRLQSRKEE